MAALRRGALVVAAAGEAGAAVWSLYRWRRADPAFDSAWRAAALASAGWLLEKKDGGKARLVRSKRQLRFDSDRRALFLGGLERSCHTRESAEAALVHPSTVYRHIRRDPGFELDNEAALERGLAYLERLACEERAAAAAKRAGRPIVPAQGARPTTDFDTQMRLLRRWRRRDGSLGPRRVGRPSLRRWSFEESMELLGRRLRGLGIVIPSS